MSTSTVPAVLAALVQMTQAALPTTEVIDGEPLDGRPGDFVAIGHSGSGTAVNQGEQDSADRPSRFLENYDVASQFVAWSGGPDIAAVRARAYDLLDGFVTALLADPTLAGTCQDVQFIQHELSQPQTKKGAMAVIEAVVHVRARRNNLV